jgi:beta-glucosidase
MKPRLNHVVSVFAGGARARRNKRVSVNLGARAFAYFDPAAKQWHIAPGSFGILIGRSSEEIVLKVSVAVPEAIAKTRM